MRQRHEENPRAATVSRRVGPVLLVGRSVGRGHVRNASDKQSARHDCGRPHRKLYGHVLSVTGAREERPYRYRLGAPRRAPTHIAKMSVTSPLFLLQGAMQLLQMLPNRQVLRASIFTLTTVYTLVCAFFVVYQAGVITGYSGWVEVIN